MLKRRIVWLAVAAAAIGRVAMTEAVQNTLSAEVKSVQGTPLLFINGRPQRPLVFFGSLRLGGSAIPVEIGTEARESRTEFTMPEDQANGSVHVRVGGSPGTVWIESVSLTADGAPQENLLGIGPFDAATWDRDWRFFVKTELDARATARVEAGALRVEMAHGGSEPWHVHLYHPDLRLEKGKRYSLSVRLRASAPHKGDLLVVEQGGNWTHYTGGKSPVLHEIQLAAAAGVHIHSFSVPLPWPSEDGTTDWTALDRTIEAVLAADPEGLLLPRFGMEPPAAWKERHPGQLMQYDTGPGRLVSVASTAWRRDASAALRAFVGHLEEKYGEHMLGYHPCGQNTGEWFYEDSWAKKVNCLELPMAEGFRAWVHGKYATEDALRAAWAEPRATFATAAPPTREQRVTSSLGVFRDPATERRAIDFHEYQQVAMVEPLEAFARVIKEATGRRKLVTLFYGYLHELAAMPYGPQNSGHLALGRLLDCPDVDIVCSPISYGERNSGGLGAFMVAVDSVAARGKLWLNEDDTRTHVSAATSGYGRVDTPEETRGVHRRNVGHLLPRRMACWWMDLPGEGWLDDAGIWRDINALRAIYPEDAAPAPYRPEIAVIVDERSAFSLAAGRSVTWPLLALLRGSLYRIGAPCGFYLLEDLVAGRVPDARLYLFLNAFSLDARQREAIARATRRDGKVAAFFYATGLLDGTADPAHMADLMGIGFTLSREPLKPFVVPTEGSLAAGIAPFGTEEAISPRLIPAAEGVQVLGRYRDGGEPAVVLRSADGYHTVSIGALTAPPELLRRLVRLAGAHLYVESDDVVSAGGGWLTIHARDAGERHIRLPRPAAVRDALTNRVIGRDVREWSVPLAKGETAIYRVE